MKNLLIIIVAVLALGCQTAPQKKGRPADVEKVLRLFVDAVAQSDMELIDQLVSPGFIIYENGKIWNVDSLYKALEGYRDIKISYNIENVDITADYNTARAIFTNTGTFDFTNTVTTLKFAESATFVKINNQWKVEFYHSTHIRYQ